MLFNKVRTVLIWVRISTTNFSDRKGSSSIKLYCSIHIINVTFSVKNYLKYSNEMYKINSNVYEKKNTNVNKFIETYIHIIYAKYKELIKHNFHLLNEQTHVWWDHRRHASSALESQKRNNTFEKSINKMNEITAVWQHVVSRPVKLYVF